VKEDVMDRSSNIHGERWNACWISVRKSNRLLGRLRRRWEDDIKMDLKERG
jgi:hypothetical protein